MKYINHSDLEKIKKIDLLTFLSNYEPDRLKKVSRGTYCIRDHESLHISNGLWHWQSMGIGGRSALDFLIKVDNYSFLEAASYLMKLVKEKQPEYCKHSVKEEIKQLQIPIRSTANDEAISYLCNRGIDLEIIYDCIEKQLIYESKHKDAYSKKIYTNVTFVGYDKYDKNPKYANVRSIYEDFRGDAAGSDKRYSFCLSSAIPSCEVHICEAAIDALSYATLLKQKGEYYKNVHILSLGGVAVPRKDMPTEMKTPVALEQYLKDYPDITTIYLHLDNDRAGRLATKSIMENLKNMKCYDIPPRFGKDVNDELMIRLGLKNQHVNKDIKSMER